MGAGDDPAGDAPAGHDALPVAGAPARRRPPGAIMFDGASRDYVLDGRNQYRTVHWVDQKVALALIIEEADVAAVPTLGSRLRRIDRGSAMKLQTAAEDAVRLALKPMLDAREVELVRVEATTPARGQLLVTVTYRNLILLDERQPRTVELRA